MPYAIEEEDKVKRQKQELEDEKFRDTLNVIKQIKNNTDAIKML